MALVWVGALHALMTHLHHFEMPEEHVLDDAIKVKRIIK
jgi:hypothetical protein